MSAPLPQPLAAGAQPMPAFLLELPALRGPCRVLCLPCQEQSVAAPFTRCRCRPPSRGLIDRVLVAAEAEGIDVVLGLNKVHTPPLEVSRRCASNTERCLTEGSCAAIVVAG